MAGRYVHKLAGIFERNRDRELLTDLRTGDKQTYGQFMHNSLVLAGFLQEHGAGPERPVVFSMENSVELATLYFACMHLRARILPINPAFHAKDYTAILGGKRDLLFVTTPAIRARIEANLAAVPGLRVLCLEAATEPVKDSQRSLLNVDYAAALAGKALPREPFGNSEDDDVFLTMYTSGTTSAPKGIDICYGGLLGNGLAFTERLGVGRDHRFYNVLPMTYLGGLYNLMLIPILAEGSFVADSTFGVSNLYCFWENVKDYGVNTLWFTSTMLSMLLALEDDQDMSFLRQQIRLGLCGMAPLHVDLKKRFEDRFGITLYENYGISETTFLTTNHSGLSYKPGSAGTALPGVDVQIVDQELKPVPSGAEGQILIKTPYFMKGYCQSAKSDQANVLADGSFLTGDIGRIDDGELFVTGRLKDLIIRGGINICPKSLEDTIYKLEQVQEVAVVGIPHPIYGEEVAAVVKIRKPFKDTFSVAAVKKYCEDNIANFQRPKFVYFIDELPKGATGKIQKNVLKRLITEKINPLNMAS